MASNFTWNGDRIKNKAMEASKQGINKTMSVCVISAKRNHPGWQNRTGTAEGSVDVTRFAYQHGNAVIGEWGSRNVHYVIWLELKHGSFLRNSADRNYPMLPGEIKKAYRSMGAVS